MLVKGGESARSALEGVGGTAPQPLPLGQVMLQGRKAAAERAPPVVEDKSGQPRKPAEDMKLDPALIIPMPGSTAASDAVEGEDPGDAWEDAHDESTAEVGRGDTPQDSGHEGIDQATASSRLGGLAPH